MSPRDTLVLMGCSMTKREGHLPAYELYDGPLWQTLRTRIGAIPQGNVCVLSGKFGFINAMSWITPYEARLSEMAAFRLIERGIRAHNDHCGRLKHLMGCNAIVEAGGTLRLSPSEPRPYTHVILCASGPYQRVLNKFLLEFVGIGLVAEQAPIKVTSGGIGEQRRQLGAYLYEVNAMTRELA